MLQIYITDLAAYNSEALVGKWVSLPCEEAELQKSDQLGHSFQKHLDTYFTFTWTLKSVNTWTLF